jgi:hypothetical protein
LSAGAPGFEPQMMSVVMSLGERKEMNLVLTPIATGMVNLSAEPQDASISIDSAPFGHAPLTINLDGSKSFVEATFPGYEPKTAVLPASGNSEVTMKLRLEDGLGPSGRIEAAKDRFYWAFGFFMITIPAISLTAGLYNDYASAYTRATDANSAYSYMLVAPGSKSYTALTISITAACLTGFIAGYNLIQYLGSTQ